MTTKRTTQFTPPVDNPKYTRRNVTVPFNEITEPGAYYFHPTGWLYRVPGDSLSLGHSPLMNICSTDECYVTKISDDPWIPVNKAREICSNWDFCVNF
ncbi:MAG: hypothetical protein ACE5K8_10370 [Candidatus Zixiibacteriota bacterium]